MRARAGLLLCTLSVALGFLGAGSAVADDDVAAANDVAATGDDGAVDDGDDDAGPKRAVTLLPLRPGRTITSKQAAGITARLRVAADALDKEGAITLLPSTKDDDKAVRRCGDKVDCYRDVASARGADVAIAGAVEVGEGGLLLVPMLAGEGAARITLPNSVLVTADDDTNGLALDRLARELCAPETLRGSLSLRGQPGDAVFVDGRRRGTLDEEGVFVAEGLREGPHQVKVERPAGKNGLLYEPFEREVSIVHRDEVKLKITLLPKEGTEAMAGGEQTDGPPTIAVAGVVVAGVAEAAGAVVGVFSLLDSFAVEERAEAQQLVFPRDTELVQRGQALALGANVLFGVGAVVGGASALWWVLGSADAASDSDERSSP